MKIKSTLSAQESRLLLKLAWEKKRLVDLSGIVRILRISRSHAYKLASVLCRKKWLERLTSGSYQVIPFEGGPKRVAEMNPYVIGGLLKEPYFFSYATAITHYGFSSQIYGTLFIAVKRRRRPLLVKSTKIQFIMLADAKFFGFTETEIIGEKVHMAEKEKALLDSLDKPSYAGGIEEVFSAFQRAKDKVNYEKIVEYAGRFKTTALLQRLGFLLDFLGISISKKLWRRLLDNTCQGQPIFLATPHRFERKGEFFKKWKIIQNVPEEILRSR